MKYAYYSLATGEILSWIDTDTHNYVLPASSMLHECSDSEWSLDRSSKLAVISGSVVPYIAAAITPIPDANGFIQAIKTALGGIMASNTLAIAYPLFFSAVQSGAWLDVQALIIDAHTKTLLTDTQYSAFKAAAVTYNVPVTL
jgi:hypothetical protein